MWEQELAELLAHKTCPLDLLHDHLGQELLWENQLQQHTLENENDKKLENKELYKKNFQSLIYKKLVALLQKKHFASVASSQLLGYEAWGKYREASEDSFDKVGDKKFYKNSFENKSLAAKTFGQLTFGHFAQAASKRPASQRKPLPTPAWAKRASQTAT